MVSLHCPHHTSWDEWPVGWATVPLAHLLLHAMTGNQGASTLPSLVTFFVCPQVPPLHCCVSDLLRGKTCH